MKRFLPLFLLLTLTGGAAIAYGWDMPSFYKEYHAEQQPPQDHDEEGPDDEDEEKEDDDYD